MPYMPYELFIGLRYTATRRRNGFLSFISWISIAGLTLGVGALIVVLSVMNGFQDELRTRILGVAAHVQITGFDGELADWQSVALAVATNPEVRASAPYVAAQGMLTHGGEVRGVAVRGVLQLHRRLRGAGHRSRVDVAADHGCARAWPARVSRRGGRGGVGTGLARESQTGFGRTGGGGSQCLHGGVPTGGAKP